MENRICVHSTVDYDSIKHIDGNRTVNPKNVESIKRSMAEKQLVVPALLNEKMEIIDGQHRLSACRDLGLPFYYIIVEGYSLSDVQRVNANMKNWRLEDFLDSFIDLYNAGNSEYAQYAELKFFIEQTGLPLQTALVLSDIAGARYTVENNFRNGNFKFVNRDLAYEVAEALKDFEPYDHAKWKQVSFATMFCKLYFNATYSHSTMLKNLPQKSGLFSLMSNKKSILTYLIEIHNHRTPRKNRVYENVINDSWAEMLSNIEEK